jgi:two-component system response regulator PilR (NtrC family)
MSEKIPLWVVEDEPALRVVLGELLKRPGYEVRFFDNAEAALAAAGQEPAPRVVLSDLALPGASGLELLEQLKALGQPLEFVLMTAFASAESALKALRLGAFDYVSKPFKNDELLNVVANAADKLRLTQENQRLKQALDNMSPAIELIGQAPRFRQMLALIDSLGNAVSNVLITGESGTGKELVARTLHRRGMPASAPFVSLNCGAMPEPLLESELFGYQKGAFTGASENRRGLIESAQGGILFLDEIGELTLTMQVKLLRVLQEKKVRPLGSAEERAVDFRLICATNRELKAAVKEGKFREDLFYRINVIHVEAPPLRERVEDIPLLAHHFLKKFAPLAAHPLQGFTAAALRRLGQHPWPGNIRELQNVIERAMVLSQGPEITVEDLGIEMAEAPVSALTMDLPKAGINLETMLDTLRTRLLTQALERTHGSLSATASLLNLSPRSLRYYLKKLDIQTGDKSGEFPPVK